MHKRMRKKISKKRSRSTTQWFIRGKEMRQEKIEEMKQKGKK